MCLDPEHMTSHVVSLWEGFAAVKTFQTASRLMPATKLFIEHNWGKFNEM